MKERILEELKRIEQEMDIKILYACESGSRAWGFPSHDSDFDIRFIYVHKRDWYLSIDDKKDSFADVGKVLDFGGWELRKVLKLFRTTNSSLYEKLQSPIVYREEDGFREGLLSLVDSYYDPVKGLYHYLSLARNFMKDELQSDEVKLKKLFYCFRSVLAAEWIKRYNEVPPMELKDLRVLVASSEVNQWIDEMLVLKLAGDESLLIERNDSINAYLNEMMDEVDRYVKSLSKRERSPSDELNKLFRQWISN